MENIDNRKDFNLVTHWERVKRSKGANALRGKPNFKSCAIFSEDLAAIHMGTLKVYYNKPLYLGCSILELSKTVLYNFYYDVKENFNDNVRLLYIDTDIYITFTIL